MFYAKRRLDRLEQEIEYRRRDISALQKSYWELLEAHDRLLKHLGLKEVERPKSVVLITVPKSRMDEQLDDALAAKGG